MSTEPHTDVLHSFDTACINRLADRGGLPADSDRKRFAESVREAVRIYVRDAQAPNFNQLHAEIAALHVAAHNKRYGQVAELLERLSPEANAILSKRQLNVELPASRDLRDQTRQQAACEAVFRLCQRGGGYIEGRQRSSGKRSRTWRPQLVGPIPEFDPLKRQAEHNFVMHLQCAWLEATGKLPKSLTASATNPGPFAQMVIEALNLVGAHHANGAELINRLNIRRKDPNSRRTRKRPVKHEN